MSEPYLVIVTFFLFASLVFYLNLGGADFGAGILEFLPAGKFRQGQRQLINSAMGPVWEANHIWLILVLVILFMGFPEAFTVLMTSLHLPVVALLIGIVLRGTAFVFRHYDTSQDETTQRRYSLVFALSSVWSSFWIGNLAGALFQGNIDLKAQSFAEAYVYSWAAPLPFMLGVFLLLIFPYLASIFLIGETEEPEMKKFFAHRALVLNLLVVVWGGLTLGLGYLGLLPGYHEFFDNPVSIVCLILATISFLSLWSISKRKRPWLTRTIAALQTVLILVGWYAGHAPNIFYTKEGEVSLWELAAPEATLRQLSLALLVGSLFIFPSLFFLFKIFKSAGHEKPSEESERIRPE